MAGILCSLRFTQARRSRRSAQPNEAFTHEHSQRQSAASDPWHDSRAGRIGVGPCSSRHTPSKACLGGTHSVHNKWHALYCPGNCAAGTPTQCWAQVHLGAGRIGLVDMVHGYLRGGQLMVGDDADVAYKCYSSKCHRRRTMARTGRQANPHQCWIGAGHRVDAACRRLSDACIKHRTTRCVRTPDWRAV